MEHNQLILSAKDVHIQFNLRGKVLHAIRGIDLDLYQGEVLAIVGESGSGKSVFTKSFMGLLDANGSITEGTIDYYGMAGGQPLRLSGLKTEKDWLRVRGREIAMVMQDPHKGVVPVGFGTDAIGGVVNIVTNKQPGKWFLDASYSYGSFNTHKSYVRFGQIFKNGFMYEVNAFQNFSDNDYYVDTYVRDF